MKPVTLPVFLLAFLFHDNLDFPDAVASVQPYRQEQPKANPPKLDWEMLDESEGIKAYRREVPGSSVYEFKGVGMVDAPISKIATVIFDSTRTPEWMPDLAFSKLVRWISIDEF